MNSGSSCHLAVFVNSLGLGGTEKAACAWATLLNRRSPQIKIKVLTLEDGPRSKGLAEDGIPFEVLGKDVSPEKLAESLSQTDVIHAHAPGFPHQGDILGDALALLARKVPVIQTNIFGQLRNPREEAWTDFRLFISWTSCVQAARRFGRKLDRDFFRRQSVASYPLDTPAKQLLDSLSTQSNAFRKRLGLDANEVLFGRFSRPEPNKWTPLVLEAFLKARRGRSNIRLLLQEPPKEVTDDLVKAGLGFLPDLTSIYPLPTTAPIIILRATSDTNELSVNQAACDVVLHTSSIGESFGYGIAEPMALGKPVITNSVPWHDQAQIELVRHGECGLVASTIQSMHSAIEAFANGIDLRKSCGRRAAEHIAKLANPNVSADRLQIAIDCTISGNDNPNLELDLEVARKTGEYLDRHQWGHSLEESLWLRSSYAKIQFLHWQRRIRDRLVSRHR